MFLFAATIFVSAFLLFQVQPVIAKMILPWFGGSAMVWTSCMLFFQLLLLAGYAYSHRLVERPRDRQSRLHLTLLGLSLLSLPIIPRAIFKPQGGDNPLLGILLVLATSVGLPYFMLSTTGPLMQAWYSALHPGKLPYRLFALSNLGSLIALIAYPVAVEPSVPLRMQGFVWSGLYAVFAVLCAYTAWRVRNAPIPAPDPVPVPAEGEIAAEAPAIPPPPSMRQRIAWVALAACASVLLLSVTNYLSQNVAAIPFLWVLPLSLYLLSFMLTFDSDFWYQHWFFAVLTAATLGLMAYPFWKPGDETNMKLYIVAYSAGLFICCMFCHGEIARKKPHPRYLTGFYLMISIGGALGGLFVSLLAPLLLPYHYDLSVGLAMLGLAGLFALYRESWITDILWAALAIFLIVSVYRDIQNSRGDNILITRNFYGALRIRESGSDLDSSKLRTLVNGTINHGAQYVSKERSRVPTTYYGEKTGAGLSIIELRHPGMKLGVIGLGTGTLSTYGKPGDRVKIYEINPRVVEIARTWFTYLRDCEAKVDMVMGDARLSLEREDPNDFDVLAVDAFSSDAIPVHLLTLEAVQLYLKHIRPDGVVAIHVSNKYLSLTPVVRRIAQELKKPVLQVESRENGALEQFSADWILVAHSPQVFDRPAFRAAASNPAPEPGTPLWTDDYSNLFRIMR
jgi:SAM-dependent methyltransferase